MHNEKIHDINEFITKCDALSFEGSDTYRGQCCSSWPLEPGIIRRIKKTYSEIGQGSLLLSCARNLTVDLIERARNKPDFKRDEYDLRILAILQHYGAATPLLDFTYHPLVALYFACQSYTKNGAESDGKVFSINYSKQVRSNKSQILSFGDPARESIKTIFDPSGHRGIWRWVVPDDLPCKRSKKQCSIFVFGWGLLWEYNAKMLVNELQVLTISAESKKEILVALKDKHDISEESLLPDVYGFAQSNRHDKIIQYFSAEDLYAKGEEADNYEWKAEFYRMAFKKSPDWIDAGCKCIIALNWNGQQDDALEIVESSIIRLGENWKLLVCKAFTYERYELEWKPILQKAKQVAVGANESECFELFARKLLPLDSVS